MLLLRKTGNREWWKDDELLALTMREDLLLVARLPRPRRGERAVLVFRNAGRRGTVSGGQVGAGVTLVAGEGGGGREGRSDGDADGKGNL